MKADPTPPHGGVPSAPSFQPGRILVVDDRASNIQLVGATLGSLGCDIIPAQDGPTALKRLSLAAPDLVLLDLLMPNMNGCEVCRRIRENEAWKDIPIIFLSAAGDKELVVEALEAGGVDYITKPFNRAELVTRVRTHLELKFARDRLKELAEDKDEMLGIMAHDCKNQLGGLQMTAELLVETARAQGHERLLRLAENMEHNSSQMLAFVQEFLANASVEHGLSLKPQPVRLADLLARVAQHYQSKAKRKTIALHLDAPPSLPAILADPTALQQVLENLLSNAVKFSPPQSNVSIRASFADGKVLCSVADQGPGFTPDDKTRMFRRYARLSARPTGGEPSTGLGLSIVKTLVAAMHGGLQCDSEPGRGARFTLAFDALPSSHPAPAPAN